MPFSQSETLCAKMEEVCTACNVTLPRTVPRRRCLDCPSCVLCTVCAETLAAGAHDASHTWSTEEASITDAYDEVREAVAASMDAGFRTAFRVWATRPAFASLTKDGGAVTVSPYCSYAQLYEQVSTLAGLLRATQCTVVGLSFQGNPQLLYTLEAACVLANLCSCCIPAALDPDLWLQCALEAGVTLAVGNCALVEASKRWDTPGAPTIIGAEDFSPVDLQAVAHINSTSRGASILTTPCLVKYSSGSTGRPKGVRITSAVGFTRTHFGSLPMVALSCYPPCWSTDTAVVWSSFLQGARVVFGDPAAVDVLDMHAVARPTSVVLTPYLAAGLQRRYAAVVAATAAASTEARARLAGALAAFDQVGGRCRHVTVGGAAVSADLLQFLRDVLPCRVTESYGTTETHGITFNGRIIEGVAVKLVPLPGFADPDTGEVCVLTKDMVRPEDWVAGPPIDKYLPEGHLRTGDVGRLCPVTGRLHLLGRVANAVKLPTGVFFCPEALEKLLVPGLAGLLAAVVSVDSRGAVGVHITPDADADADAGTGTGTDGEDPERYWLDKIGTTAARAGLPVPTWVKVQGLGALVQDQGTWKPRRPAPMTLRQLVRRLLGREDWPADASLRHVGLDSLGAMQVAHFMGPSFPFTTIMQSTMAQLEAAAVAAAEPVPEAAAAAAVEPVPEAAALADTAATTAKMVWVKPSAGALAWRKVVFVTGGTGFVGQGVVEALLARADVAQVWCLVRATSVIPAVWKLTAAKAPFRLQWVVGDVSLPGLGLPSNLGALPSEFSAVIHAAADVKAYDLGAAALLRDTNVEGTANVLAFAAARAAARFIHVSTTSVENVHLDAYGATKAAAEDIVKPWAGPGLPGVIVRVPLVVGNNREDWVHRMADACRDLGARPACDFLFKQPVWAVDLRACCQELVLLACDGPRIPRQVWHMASEPMQVTDLLRTCWPTIDHDLRPVNDAAWVHAARAGTRFAPLA